MSVLTYRHELLSGGVHARDLAITAAVHIVVVARQDRGLGHVLERGRQRVVKSNAPLQR